MSPRSSSGTMLGVKMPDKRADWGIVESVESARPLTASEADQIAPTSIARGKSPPMPRKRPQVEVDRARVSDSEPLPLVPLAQFAGLGLFSLVVFYRPGAPAHWGNEPRRAALHFAAAPDLLVEMWCGGKF